MAFTVMKRAETLHAIAFIDMLGSTARIQSKGSEEALNSIYRVYDQMINVYCTGEISVENIKMRAFSDNIIIARPIGDNEKEKAYGLNQMIALAAGFQLCSLLNGWLSRGGITIGKLFVDDIMVWGEGLVQAYQLESKSAIFPRIVIDKTALFSLLKNYSQSIHCWKMDLGLPIVDFLGMKMNNVTDINLLLRGALNNILYPSEYDDRIVSKQAWLIQYYNEWCSKNGFEHYKNGSTKQINDE